jgi:hypothetical protein
MGNNKIKLLVDYENVTQKDLLSLESMLHNAKKLQHVQASWIRPKSSCEVLGLPATFWYRTLQVC